MRSGKHERMARREVEKAKDKIVVLDFGGQYSHLIVRRCRELGVYAELFPFDVPLETLKQGLEQNEGTGKLRGIILSGSPFGVHELDSPRCSSEIVKLNVPLLGICYGAQLIADMMGGVVVTGGKGEFGRTELSFTDSALFDGVSANGKTNVWMSHGDVIERFDGADVLGSAENSPIAAFRIRDNIYGVQFHPEVHHTAMGDKILWNFLYAICDCERNWTIASFVEEAITQIREAVGAEGRVICGLSGGIDSSTTAVLINKAIGDRLTCIFVDNGLLRAGSKEAGVSLVTSFLISSSCRPIAIFAATLAMGYPVAFDASAEDRDTRGLTSITRYSPSFNANWMLQPPSTFNARMIFIAAERNI